MNTKKDRHRAILRVIAETPVATQSALKQLVQKHGHKVDQATLSRDIRELGLVKIINGNGHYRYASVDSISTAPTPQKRFIRSIDTSKNLIVAKTNPGEASSLALTIDRMGWKDVLGTIAGDDTIMIVIKEKTPAKKIAKKVEELQQ